MIPSECFADEQREKKKSFNYLEALSTTANGKVSLRFCCCSGAFVKLRGWLQFIITLEKIEWAVRLRPKQLQSCVCKEIAACASTADTNAVRQQLAPGQVMETLD